LPLLLKPAPTRLRLVLWSLSQGMDEFPDAPPPGLVTVPARNDAPKGYYTMAGYRAAGERAIRIDMLERLADMLRSEDTRGGFEAKPDMLSITGMTLEQFALLMQGLGYKAERAERAKVKPVDQVVIETAPEAAPETEAATPDAAAVSVVAEEAAPAAIDEAPVESLATGTSPEVATPEIEVYYTFTWAPRANRPRGERPAQGRAQGGRGPRGAQAGEGAPSEGDAAQKRDRPQRQGGKPRGKPGKGKPREPREEQPKTYAAKPEKRNDRIDPDNPFAAALMGLRTKD
ncbi:MAG: disulfide oxidoreductase, partial [Roseovarius sp.]